MSEQWIKCSERLPSYPECESSDSDVLIKTSKGRVFSAYTYMEKVLNDEITDWEWKKTWSSNLNGAEVDDYLNSGETIDYWMPMPI